MTVALLRLFMGIAIPRGVGVRATGMAAAKRGRRARIKECEKYILYWKRSGKLKMSGRGLDVLGRTGGRC